MTDNPPTVSPLPPLDLDAIYERYADAHNTWRTAGVGDAAESWASALDVPHLLRYIDAMRDQALTPTEAALADALIRVGHPSGLDETDCVVLRKLGQIAGDR